VSRRHPIRVAAAALLGFAAIPVALGLFIIGADWWGHRQAQEFCDGIEPGSDISAAVRAFEGRVGKPGVLHDGDASGHLFMFKGFMFDKSYCSIALSAEGKVTRKIVYATSD
jgi:hypothetical protein